MAVPTRLVLQGIIDTLLNDGEITDAEIQDAINEAILSVRGDMLSVSETAVTVAAAATLLYTGNMDFIYSIEIDGELIPDYAWYIRETPLAVLVFSPGYFAGAPSGTLVISGGAIQEILASDGAPLLIDPGYVTARAIANLHSSRGGTGSALADWHKSEHSKWAAIAETRLPTALALYGPPPHAKIVRARLTV